MDLNGTPGTVIVMDTLALWAPVEYLLGCQGHGIGSCHSQVLVLVGKIQVVHQQSLGKAQQQGMQQDAFQALIKGRHTLEEERTVAVALQHIPQLVAS